MDGKLQIKIKYLSNKINKLKKIEKGDWIDLVSSEEVTMRAGEQKLIPLGIAMQLPDSYEAYILPRSSTLKNFGILLGNSQGVVDNSYCGNSDEWKMSALCVRDTEIHVNDRICQFRIQKKQPEFDFIEVDDLGNEDRGGWGSTGIQ
jgi:dUTP pyrophosphatase